MKRRPPPVPQAPVHPVGFISSIQAEIPSGSVETIVPFLRSGGQNYHIVSQTVDTRPDGVQLVAAVYISRGFTGFLKQLRIAPFCPPVLADPFRGWDATWRVFDNSGADDEPIRPGSQLGLWETPFGWESYYDPAGEDPPPMWRWHLRLVKGNIDDLRRHRTNLPAFDITNPATYYLVPDVPAQRTAYPGGIPGTQAGFQFGPQRVQVLQGDQLSLHVPIPEDSTLCLFCEWTQAELSGAWARDDNGIIRYDDTLTTDNVYYALLPAFGQLLGYMQPADRAATLDNARYGWGG